MIQWMKHKWLLSPVLDTIKTCLHFVLSHLFHCSLAKCELASAINREACYKAILERREATIMDLDAKLETASSCAGSEYGTAQVC